MPFPLPFEKKVSPRNWGTKTLVLTENGLALSSPAERRKRGCACFSEAEAGVRYVVNSGLRSATGSFWNSSRKRDSVPAFRIGVEARNYDGTVSLSVDKEPDSSWHIGCGANLGSLKL